MGDPILTDFEGRSFEFMGEVGEYYDVISEEQHQVRRNPFSCLVRLLRCMSRKIIMKRSPFAATICMGEIRGC